MNMKCQSPQMYFRLPSDVRNVILCVHVNVHSTSSRLSYAQQGLESSYPTEDQIAKAEPMGKAFPLCSSAIKNEGVWEGTI